MNETSYHYNVISRAIRLIDDSRERELSLGELAGRMNMSPAHFQRLFSQWAGVSPKRYHQYLALQHARTLLQQDTTVQEAARSVGLSGTGRLHDLFVKWEAMSPGEYSGKGAGLTINWGWFDSPFGDMLAMGTKRGLCGIAFASERGRGHTFEDLSGRWPNAGFEERPETICGWVDAALGQSGKARLLISGGPFQVKVWEALISIPAGSVSTYSEVARLAGFPDAVRAVGTAIGRNPISWLIPCHRVIRKSGELGGYRWGLPVKRALLAWESARSEAELQV